MLSPYPRTTRLENQAFCNRLKSWVFCVKAVILGIMLTHGLKYFYHGAKASIVTIHPTMPSLLVIIQHFSCASQVTC